MSKIKNESKKDKMEKVEETFETDFDFRDEPFNLKTGLNDYE